MERIIPKIKLDKKSIRYFEITKNTITIGYDESELTFNFTNDCFISISSEVHLLINNVIDFIEINVGENIAMIVLSLKEINNTVYINVDSFETLKIELTEKLLSNGEIVYTEKIFKKAYEK